MRLPRPAQLLPSDILLQIWREPSDPPGIERLAFEVPGLDGRREITLDLVQARVDLLARSLLEAARELRRTAEESELHGFEFGNALHRALQESCEAAGERALCAALERCFGPATHPGSPRCVVQCAADAEGGTLPWECWQIGENAPFLTKRWSLVRYLERLEPRDPPSTPPLVRVLVLVGSTDQQDRAEDRGAEFAAGARAVLKGIQRLSARGLPIDVRLGITQEGELADLHSDFDWEDGDEVLRELAARGPGGTVGYHAIFYFGHSAEDELGHAIGWRLAFGPREQRRYVDLHWERLAAFSTSADTRLLALFACSASAAQLRPVLEACEHVIGLQRRIDPLSFGSLASALVEALREQRSIAEGVHAMRRALKDRQERWVPLHLTRSLELRAFLDAAALERVQYGRALKLRHAKLEGPLFEARISDDVLQQLYVELELEAFEGFQLLDGEESALAASAKVGAGEPARSSAVLQRMPLEQLVLLDERSERWITRRWIVIAPPGAGKTTILRRLTRRFAADPDVLPIFVHLAELAKRARTRSDAKAIDHLLAELPSVPRALFEREDPRGRARVLLDGLDEVPQDASLWLQGFLLELCAQVRSPILVTSRKLGYRRDLLPAEFRPVRLLGPNDAADPLARREKKRELLLGWYRAQGHADAAARAERMLAKLRGRLDELTSTPLFVHLFALVEEAYPGAARSRHNVLEKAIDCLLEGKHRRDPQPLAHGELSRRALRRLAYECTAKGHSRPERHELEALLASWEGEALHHQLFVELCWRRGAEPKASATAEPRASIVGWLQTLAERTALLAPVYAATLDDARAPWSFWLKSLRDALCAEHLFHEHYLSASASGELRRERVFDRLQQDGLSLTPTPADLATWGEALALFTAWIEDPTEREAWVRELCQRHGELGYRALVFAEVRKEVLVEVLQLGKQAWSERVRVYQSLYARLRGEGDDQGDPEALLELLRACVAATRNGNDLWHLDELLARLEGEGVEGAASARAQLFAHMPLAEAQRFALRFVPGTDEPLWSEIPAGYGRRGSPDGEGHDDERPAHVIHFERPFRLSRIAITQELFQLFDPDYQPRWPGENLPATNITWFEAEIWCRWAGHVLGVEGRLPTEAEWEYGARGRSYPDAKTARTATWPPYWSGPELSAEVAWYKKDISAGPRSATEGRANPFHLRNVHGNVWEWCQDWFGPYEPAGADAVVVAPAGAARGDLRVLRGGSYWNDAVRCRAAYRDGGGPQRQFQSIGFRAYLAAPPELELRS